MTRPCERSAVEQARMVRSREISARELLDDHLARIGEVNPVLNAVVGLDPSVAQARAAAVDQAIATNRRPGPLAGIVTAHKDLLDTVDFPTTFGSPAMAGHRPEADALVVRRMREAGAVAVGKTNVPEFGAGSHTFNPVHGLTRNPWDPKRSAGGSSGGAAVALRVAMVALADGSDLGGSLRNPAAWNNVVGFRGTARVVPRVGPGNPWDPLPVEGPMARSIDDLVLLLRVLAGADEADPLHRPLNLPPFVNPPVRPIRVAWSSTLGGLPVEPGVTAVLDRLRTDLDLLGWAVVDDEPDLSGADECFETLRAFGAAQRHALVDIDLSQVKATVQAEVEQGRALSAAQVGRAMVHLGELRRRSVTFFDHYDLLIAPVTQVDPFPADQEYPTEVAGRSMDSYIEWMRSCSRITVSGCPALSLPAGFSAEGLPVGAQLIARPGADVSLLSMAKAVEATTGHGRHWPDLGALTGF